MSKKPSLNALILSALQRGEELTTLDCFRRWKTMTLSQRVSELRGAGHHIVKRNVRRNGKTIAAYRLAT